MGLRAPVLNEHVALAGMQAVQPVVPHPVDHVAEIAPPPPLAVVMNAIGLLAHTMNTFIANQAVARSEDLSVDSVPVVEARAKLPTKGEMISHFKVPPNAASAAEKENRLMDWRLKYELPLKQERNRVETRSHMKVVELLLTSEMFPITRDALVAILSRCEEILLLETHGSVYASTWARQVSLRTEEEPAMASAHRAALLASGRTATSAPINQDRAPAARHRPRHRNRKGQNVDHA